MDYVRAAMSVAGLVPRTASEERRAAVARAFSLAEVAYRVAGLDESSGEDVSSEGRTSYIKKEKGKYCVKSHKNKDWSGGCYDTKGEAEDRLKQVEMFKHMGADQSGQGDWIPAAGGAEEPFVTRGGKRLQYMWNPSTGEHAYLDLDDDLILSEEESRAILGSSEGEAGVTFKSAPEYKSVEDFVDYKMDDEDDEFDHEDLAALSYRLKSSPGKVRKQLEGYGLKLKKREPEKKGRGFQSPDHDRWYGPGSAPTHGGGGSGTKWIPSAS